jgi:hypothetical protein
MSRFGQGGSPWLSRAQVKRSRLARHAASNRRRVGILFTVEEASEAVDDGFAVSGQNKRLAFLELADLLWAQDRTIFARKGAAGRCPLSKSVGRRGPARTVKTLSHFWR